MVGQNNKGKKYLINISLLILVTIILLAFLEIGVRVGIQIKYNIEYPYPEGLFIADDKIGYVLNPKFIGIMKGRAPYEFNTVLSIREHCYMDDLNGKIDMLVLGDSFTWGWGVNESERFSNILQDFYPKKTIFNAAISGQGTYEYNEILEMLSNNLNENPTVLIGVTLANDIVDNSQVSDYH